MLSLPHPSGSEELEGVEGAGPPGSPSSAFLSADLGDLFNFWKLLISFFSFFFKHFWVHWVSFAAHGLSLAAARKGGSWMCAQASRRRPRLLLLQTRAPGAQASVAAARRPNCFATRGIEPLSAAPAGRFFFTIHQGSPNQLLFSYQ